MNSSINCGLKGSYKVDLYKDGKFVKSTDWFSNEITNVGMNYPFNYPFARCFMFLSLGSGAISTSDDRKNGTGVATPIISIPVYNPTTQISSNQSGTFIGWEGYEIGGPHDSNFIGTSSSACGTLLTNKGMNLYRGWTIPVGAFESGMYVNDNIHIKSFGVSPSSGADASGSKAFSLVDRDILIPVGHSATITYQLSLNFLNYESGYTPFKSQSVGINGWFNTGTAATGINNSELGILSTWSHLSGIYRQVYPGVQIVDSLGACVASKIFGDEMEPSIVHCKKSSFYLSPDMSQFSVSKFGKDNVVSENQAYNSLGLMANYAEFIDVFPAITLKVDSDRISSFPVSTANAYFYSGKNSADSSVSLANTDEKTTIDNIRLEGLIPISNYVTGNLEDLDYQTMLNILAKNYAVAYATYGGTGYSYSSPNYGQKMALSSYLKRIPIEAAMTGTGVGTYQRNKKVTKKALFSPIASMGPNTRFGSMVLGYRSADGLIGNLTIRPYVDFLFYDTSGRAANMPHYRLIPDICLNERGSGVSQVIFDITGANGGNPSSIRRFASAYGYMGNGTSDTLHSGLDINHPMHQGLVTDTVPSSFIPNGNKFSGYLFTGESLTINDLGNPTYNSETGWGAVYGIVATTGFYQNPYDTCLLDIPTWSGLGHTPNPTGEYVYWPISGSGLGVRVTGMKYYLKGYGDVSDVGDYFANGVKQLADDITYEGNSILGLTLSNPDPGNTTITFTHTTATPSSVTFSLLYDNSNSVTGYDFNATYTRCSGATEVQIPGYEYSADNVTFDPPLTMSSLSLSSTRWKKPSCVFHHVENIGDIGYRLLPNYANPNNEQINTYDVVKGGEYPGLSMENGLEMYLDFTWIGL